MEVEKILQDQGIDYQEAGENRFMVCCPEHDDTNPSCGLWADSGYYKCFGCGATGSFTDFLMLTLDIPQIEARRMTRGEDDISEMEDRIRADLNSDKDRMKYLSIRSFREVYPPVEEGSPEWDYVIGRGISPDMIRRFDMRSGRRKYHDRVVLPIFTHDGKLLAYVGRTVDSELAPKTKKNRSPHRTLYGLRQIVRKYPGRPLFTVVVVEGEFDAIYLQQFGIAAVSNMGTVMMGPEKIRLLRRYAKKVVLSYDGDEAGERAMYGYVKKGREIPGQVELLQPHIPTVTVTLPEGGDPNELTPTQVEDIYGRYKIGN